VIYAGLVNDFAFDYADKHRPELKNLKTPDNFKKTFVISDAIFNDFVAYAEKNKIKRNENGIKASAALVKNQLKALIARNIWNNDGFYPLMQDQDNILKKAIELMKQ
jgi:carboxyl-terminal processing protease